MRQGLDERFYQGREAQFYRSPTSPLIMSDCGPEFSLHLTRLAQVTSCVRV